jgi:hypothetical protein
MRVSKLLGLALLSLIFFAVVVVSSASAVSSLCIGAPENKGGELFCKAKEKLESVEVEGTNEGKLAFKMENGNVECGSATFVSTLSQLAGKVEGATNFSFGFCSTTIIGCLNVLSVSIPINVLTEVAYVQPTSPEGNLAFETPATTIKISCGGNTFTCVYSSKAGEIVTGNYYGNEQKLKINTTVVLSSAPNAVCSAKATLLVTYKVERKKGVVEKNNVGVGAVYIAKE